MAFQVLICIKLANLPVKLGVDAMLAEFRVSNYRSFKDEQVLSMIATSEESKGSNSVKIGKYNILKSAVVYGANASGKSNLIKAMACMHEIVTDSAGYKPNEKSYFRCRNN